MTGRTAPFPRFTGTEPCQNPNYDPDWWSSSDSHDRVAAQLACGRCPTRESCLAWALDHPTDAGDAIWAGTTPKRRTALRRQFRTATAEEPK